MTARRLGAAWVLPIGAPPIAGGAVLVDDGGRIAAVGPEAEVPSPPGIRSERFADAVLLPGFVNAHTHLELTGFEHRVPDDDFPGWIRRLRALKETRGAADYLAAARRGLADCHAMGVTTVADTGDTGTVIQALAEGNGRGIAYQEVFGPHPDQVTDSLAGLQMRVTELGRFTSERVRIGVSPHAPFSVSGPLYAAVARWARAAGLPMAVHLAESPEEIALLADGTGAFAEMWTRRGVPLPPPGRSPVAWLDEHDVLGPDTLCIHVVQAGRDDIVRLAAHRCGIAHCPLSNRRHRHGDAPLRAMLDAGLAVGLGTDSVVSVDVLDLLAEARAARAVGGLSAGEALELCTLGAARAIGMEEVGRLAAGTWGDCAVVRAAGSDADAVCEAVLASSRQDVLATYVAGGEVFRS